MATNDVAPPPPEDMHDGCGYAAANTGPVALVCNVERSYTTRAHISFYATEDQARAAVAHCRDTTSVGHTIVAANQRGRLHVQTLDPGATAPTTNRRKGTP